jgi:tetratricopeptide (TPR) repeat protein
MSKKGRARTAAKEAATGAKAPAGTSAQALAEVSGKALAATPTPARDAFWARWGIFLAGSVVVLAVLAVYHNSFSGPFVLDDTLSITNNSSIRRLGSALFPPPDSGTGGRPLLNLTFALNYALSGFNVWGYHAFNLLVHVLAGLTLFGVVRRTLLRPEFSKCGRGVLTPQSAQTRGGDTLPTTVKCFATAATPLALAIAVIWTVHPLQTEAVTYISQRAESLMGLFYLLTLYCFIRGADNRCQVSGVRYQGSEDPKIGSQPSALSSQLPVLRSFSEGGWLVASICCCLLGSMCKEIIVTAPVIVFLYDRTFVAGSFREAWQRRWRYYLGLAATWLLLAYLMTGLDQRGVGFDRDVSWWSYALTSCRSVVLYLKLAVWPHPLVLDYGTAVVQHAAEVAPYMLILVGLIVATGVALWRWPVIGFAGAWFFVILAPASSVIPVAGQPMAEHRLYLSLAAVVVLVVLGLHRLIGRRSLLVCAAVAVGLGCITVQRNKDYRSEVILWSDTITKYPNNERAHSNLGFALAKMPGHLSEAISEYEAALRINPDYADAHNNLGNALLKEPGRLPDAIAEFEQALRNNPNLVEAHYNLGNALVNVPGRLPDAIAHFEAALRLNPDLADAHISLGNALLGIPGRRPDAIVHFETALRLNPDSAVAHYDLGNALLNAPGHLNDAIAQYKEALRLKPDLAPAREILDQLQNSSGSDGVGSIDSLSHQNDIH